MKMRTTPVRRRRSGGCLGLGRAPDRLEAWGHRGPPAVPLADSPDVPSEAVALACALTCPLLRKHTLGSVDATAQHQGEALITQPNR